MINNIFFSEGSSTSHDLGVCYDSVNSGKRHGIIPEPQDDIRNTIISESHSTSNMSSCNEIHVVDKNNDMSVDFIEDSRVQIGNKYHSS